MTKTPGSTVVYDFDVVGPWPKNSRFVTHHSADKDVASTPHALAEEIDGSPVRFFNLGHIRVSVDVVGSGLDDDKVHVADVEVCKCRGDAQPIASWEDPCPAK